MFISESRERSTKNGISYGSLVDFESQNIESALLYCSGAILLQEFFGSCQFLRGLWMDLSGEIAKNPHEN